MGEKQVTTYSHPIEEANEDSIFGELTAEAYYEKQGLKHSEDWMTNARGMKIYTQTWEPMSTPIRGTVLVLHGFTGDSDWTVQLTAIGIARLGFTVHALDHQGHGRSEGLRYHIPDITPVLDDCVQFATELQSSGRTPAPFFLFGESVGGALALLLHLDRKLPVNGIILNGAMCGISPAYLPPWPLPQVLPVIAWLAPTLPIVPTRPIPQVSFKEPWKLRLVLRNPLRQLIRPRPATAKELLRVATSLNGRLRDVSVPFIALHGRQDTICDPAAVSALYELAVSQDKTLKLYDDMWHQLVGEPKVNLDVVFTDLCRWLLAHAPAAAATSS